MTPTIGPRVEHEEIVHGVAVLFEPSQVVELRALAVPDGRGRAQTWSGYFDDHRALAQEAAKLSGRAAGVYVTLQAIDPALLARRHNRVAKAENGGTTSDRDVVRYRWLPLDFDAVRPSGVSSTDVEHDLAVTRARDVRAWLDEAFGIDHSVLIDSGNGAHLLIPVPEMALQEGAALVKSCIGAVAQKFSDDRVQVDQLVGNPARIWKLPGTLVRKGDEIPEANGRPARPHRVARILEVRP